MKKPMVSIVMGSDSDLPVMEEAIKILKNMEIGYEIIVSSAHRSPERTRKFVISAEEKGIHVIIAGAGAAAHLAGFIASETVLPVIGVPIDSSSLKGIDALLSTAQMPGGIPVATMAIGKAGAKNAAIFAAQIISLNHPETREKLLLYKKNLAIQVEEKSKSIEEKLNTIIM